MKLIIPVMLIITLALALIPAGAAAQEDTQDHGARFQFGGNTTLAEDETLEFLLAADADVVIDGLVEGTIVVLGSNTVVNGRIDGHIVAAGGTLRLSDTAVVTGDVSYNGTDFVTDPDAEIQGTVRDDLGVELSRDFTRFMAWLSLANWAGTTLLALLAGVVFAGVGGRQLWSSAAAITSKPLQSILAIIALWFSGTVLIIALFFSVLGIPVAVVLLILLVVIWMLGYIVAGARIGAAMTRRSMESEERHPYLPVVTGVTVIQVVALIPVLITLLLAYTAIDDATRFSPLNLVILLISWSLSALIWVIGLLGSGALTYRAFESWTNNSNKALPQN